MMRRLGYIPRVATSPESAVVPHQSRAPLRHGKPRLVLDRARAAKLRMPGRRRDIFASMRQRWMSGMSIVAVGLLAACGGGQSSSTTSQTTAKSPTTPSASAAPSGIRGRLLTKSELAGFTPADMKVFPNIATWLAQAQLPAAQVAGRQAICGVMAFARPLARTSLTAPTQPRCPSLSSFDRPRRLAPPLPPRSPGLRRERPEHSKPSRSTASPELRWGQAEFWNQHRVQRRALLLPGRRDEWGPDGNHQSERSRAASVSPAASVGEAT